MDLKDDRNLATTIICCSKYPSYLVGYDDRVKVVNTSVLQARSNGKVKLTKYLRDHIFRMWCMWEGIYAFDWLCESKALNLNGDTNFQKSKRLECANRFEKMIEV